MKTLRSSETSRLTKRTTQNFEFRTHFAACCRTASVSLFHMYLFYFLFKTAELRQVLSHRDGLWWWNVGWVAFLVQYGPWRGLHFLPTSSLHFFHRLFLSCRFVTPVCPSVRLAVLQRSALDISLPLPMQPASFLSPLFLAARIHDDADGFLTIEASPNCRLSIFHRHCSLSLSLPPGNPLAEQDSNWTLDCLSPHCRNSVTAMFLQSVDSQLCYCRSHTTIQ